MDLKLGAMRRMYRTFGIDSAFWRKQSASCAWSCVSRLPSVYSCSTLDSQTIFRDLSPPMGALRRVALAGSTVQSEGENESMLDLDSSSTQMISDLSWFRSRLISQAAAFKLAMLAFTSLTDPLGFHHLNRTH